MGLPSLRLAPGGGLQVAYDALRPSVECVADLEMVMFRLACYACQLGNVDEGRVWLMNTFGAAERAGRLNQVRLQALDEPGLEPLWNELGHS